MRSHTLCRLLIVGLSPILGAITMAAKPKSCPARVPLNADGQKFETQYCAALKSLQADIQGSLPKINESLNTELQKATEALQKAEAQMQAATPRSRDLPRTRHRQSRRNDQEIHPQLEEVILYSWFLVPSS